MDDLNSYDRGSVVCVSANTSAHESSSVKICWKELEPRWWRQCGTQRGNWTGIGFFDVWRVAFYCFSSLRNIVQGTSMSDTSEGQPRQAPDRFKSVDRWAHFWAMKKLSLTWGVLRPHQCSTLLKREWISPTVSVWISFLKLTFFSFFCWWNRCCFSSELHELFRDRNGERHEGGFPQIPYHAYLFVRGVLRTWLRRWRNRRRGFLSIRLGE